MDWFSLVKAFFIELANVYGSYLTVGAIIISALMARGVARSSIEGQREIARKKATLDLLANSSWDRDYIAARRMFNQIATSKGRLDIWLEDEHRASEQSNAIRSILNDYELVAIGISEGILDEVLYKRWYRSQLIKDFTYYELFITSLSEKTGQMKLYKEFESLKAKWEAEGEAPKPTYQERRWTIRTRIKSAFHWRKP